MISGPAEEAVTKVSILNAWEEANSHGAINEKHQFTGQATRGRYSGQRLVFENIVPAAMAPEFAGYAGNVRLVPQSQLRKEEAPLSIRDQSYVRALQGVKREIDSTQKMLAMRNKKPLALPNRSQNATGLDMREAEARYARAVEAAGDAVNQPPAIRLKGQRLSTPSKLNGGRYRVLFEASNLSRHPTEIEVEFTVVGEVEVDGANPVYQMARVRETWKLRQAEVRQKEVWAAAKPRTYRGYTVVARFRGQTVAAVGSDNALQQIAESGNAIPQKPPKK